MDPPGNLSGLGSSPPGNPQRPRGGGKAPPVGDGPRRPAPRSGGKAPPPAMDLPPAEDSRRPASGSGGKVRQSRLGLKKPSILAPQVHPPTPPSISSSAAGTGAPGAPTSSPPAAMTSSLPGPAQGAGWGAMFPNFPAQHGNQHSSEWIYPPGGFLRMIEPPHYPPQPPGHGENFHFVGQNVAFNQSPPGSTYTTPSPQEERQDRTSSKSDHIVIDEDENNVPKKSVVKKRYWTHEEEERLASSWLEASKDPIHGNDKKGDTFWKEVTAEFNRKGNGKRTREFNQLKIHWSRLKSSIGEFNDYWSKVNQMHTSGYSDDMLEEEAQQMYANRYAKRFQLMHWWKILKEEPKWCALFETEKERTEEDDIPEEQMRPIGRDAAKAERSGKRKKAKDMEGIISLGDSIEKIAKVQQDRKVELEKATEAQLLISNTQLKAAQEEKEAKMLMVYNTLLTKSTSNMSEGEKANHARAIQKLEEKLFGD